MNAFDPTPLRPDAPAMPVHGGHNRQDDPRNQILGGGLTARQHAAIALCVPDSGCDWLDAMIEQRRRDEFAASALSGLLAAKHAYPFENIGDEFSSTAYRHADAMIAASKKGSDNGRPD